MPVDSKEFHEVARVRGDFQLNPDYVCFSSGKYKLAAVLILIVNRPHGPTVLMTRRSVNLSVHAGQISFPGGRVEPQDESAVDTALRETMEEIGLDSQQLEIVGRLDTYQTGTGYSITPIVGFTASDVSLTLNPSEVEEVFELPLTFVLDGNNFKRHSRYFDGVERKFYALEYGRYYVWGATAGMLVNLCEKIRD